MGHGAGVFDELFQAGHDGRASEESAKDFDFVTKLFARDRLDELFYGDASAGIEFRHLRSRGTRDFQRFAFCGELSDEAVREILVEEAEPG